jgi:MYXO-CTERM domain-containing protein
MVRLARLTLAALSVCSALTVAACAFDMEEGGGTPSDDLGTVEEGLTVCAAGSTIKGIDVSHWQGSINWTKVYGAGYRFAIMKASEGTGYTDDTFKTNWAASKKAGLIRGAYHFFRPKYDGVAQAKHFVSVMGNLTTTDLPPVLDLEVQDGVSDATVISRAKAFLETVEKLTGKTPVIYTGYFFTSLGSPSGFSKYPLWVAHWGVSCPNIPSGGWKKWTFWQNTDKASVSGIGGAVDGDKFNGTLADLKAFAHGPDHKVAGALETATCKKLAGWAWDPDTPGKALTVSIFADGDNKTGTLVAKVSAGDKRDDLCTKLGSCNHAFSTALPDAFIDGQQHALRAYATGDMGGAVQLGTGSKSITCDPPTTGTGGSAGAAGAAGAAGSAGAAGDTGAGGTDGWAGAAGSDPIGAAGSAGEAGAAGNDASGDSGDSSGCSTSPRGTDGSAWLALAALGIALGASRRRR